MIFKKQEAHWREEVGLFTALLFFAKGVVRKAPAGACAAGAHMAAIFALSKCLGLVGYPHAKLDLVAVGLCLLMTGIMMWGLLSQMTQWRPHRGWLMLGAALPTMLAVPWLYWHPILTATAGSTAAALVPLFQTHEVSMVLIPAGLVTQPILWAILWVDVTGGAQVVGMFAGYARRVAAAVRGLPRTIRDACLKVAEPSHEDWSRLEENRLMKQAKKTAAGKGKATKRL